MPSNHAIPNPAFVSVDAMTGEIATDVPFAATQILDCPCAVLTPLRAFARR